LTLSCDDATGAAGGGDVVVTYTVEIDDILDESGCGTVSIDNSATFTARYEDPASPGSRLDLPAPIVDTNTVSAEHLTMQKDASAANRPGDTITYTASFQVTDYTAGVDGLVFDDLLPDGTGSFAHLNLEIDANPITIVPLVIANPDGTTDITYDIGAAAAAAVQPIGGGSTITLRYSVDILQSYSATGPLTGQPVRARDSLTNRASATYDLADGAGGCRNLSSATVTVTDVGVSKAILNPQAEYEPGETVTFLLTMQVPSGDVQNISFEDFFPLPVFDATDIDTTFGNDIRHGSAHTLGAGYVPTAITTDGPTNSLRIEWPDIETTTTQTLQVEVDVVIQDQPFADGLVLQNLLRVTTDNTGVDNAADITPGPITIRAPKLTMTKGVAAVDNPSATLTAPSSTLPVDGNAQQIDAGDTLTYVLTIENQGGAEAYDVVLTDTPDAELTGCAVISVTDGLGTTILTSGDLFGAGLELSDDSLGIGQGALAANDGSPLGGGPPFATDTALVTVTCTVAATVEPGLTIANTASTVWASGEGEPQFPAQEDDAQATVAIPTIDKSFVASSPDPDSNPATVAIGEIVTYQVDLTIPEGETISASLFDQIDRGLAFLDVLPIETFSGGLATADITFSAVPTVTISDAGTGVDLDRRLTIDFGDITNANDDDGAVETIRLRYRAVVLNWDNNDRGDVRNNRADFRWDPPGPTAQTQISDQAPNVRIVEPLLEVGKGISPATAVGADTVMVSITIEHAVASNSSAFEASFSDTLPGELLNPRNFDLSGCATPPTSGAPANGANPVVASWDVFPVGASCTITFDVDVIDPIPAGTSVSNTVSAEWSSLATSVAPQIPGNDLSGERTGDTADPGGAANTYGDEGSAVLQIQDVGITKTVLSSSETTTGQTQGDGAVTDLAVGEIVTFQLVVAIPQNTTADPLIVRDSMPFAPGVLGVVAARFVSQGANVAPSPLNPSITVSDNALGDGVDDAVEMDFGAVNTTAATDVETIVIEIDAVVMNDPIRNTSITRMTNSALVQFNSSLSGSSTVDVEVVEPLLEVLKEGDVGIADAGDAVTFTTTVRHLQSSTSDAFDVAFSDPLDPSAFIIVGGPALGACADAPDSGPTFSGGAVVASWDNFARGASCEISYTVEIGGGFQPGDELINTAGLDWTSVDSDPEDQARDRDDSSEWEIVISQPGLDKTIVATSVVETEQDQKGTADDLTIGETVTFRMTATLPDATLENALFTDQLPTGDVVLEVVSSEVVSIGSDITTAVVETEAGVASDSDGDGIDDLVTWNLGTVVNTGDSLPDPNPDDLIVFEVVAVVRDLAVNQGVPGVDLNVLNISRLVTDTVDISGTAPFDIVAPDLVLTKTPLPSDPLLVEAGASIPYRITIEHTSQSTAAALALTVTDTLLGGNATYTAGTATSTCPGFTETAAAPLTIDIPGLPLSVPSCTVDYTLTLSAALPATGTFKNTAGLVWESAPGSGESRPGSAMDDGTLNSAATYQLEKTIVDTSLSGTEMGFHDSAIVDAGIGETVTYQLVATLSQGTSTAVVVGDSVDAGLEIVGARIVSVGSQIIDGGTTQPGTPSITAGPGNAVTFNFGNVTNTADFVDDEGDQIVLEVVARVLNVASNTGDDPMAAPTVLQNGATLSVNSVEEGSDDESVEVVEPRLELSKSMQAVNGFAEVTLTLANTGTAPAYDPLFIDRFDETKFVALSAQEEDLPVGWGLSQVSSAGFTTVTIDTGSPILPSPDQVLDPGEVLSVVFRIEVRTDLSASDLPVQNDARAEGSSLPGDQTDERVGDDGTPEDDINDDATADLDVPILTVEKTGSPSPASAGQIITYTIAVTNNGTAEATGIMVSDTPPSGGCAGNPMCVTFVAGTVTAVGGTVVTGNTVGDTTVEAEFETLAPSASVSVTYRVQVPNPLAAGVTFNVNQASADSAETDPKDSDDPGTPDPDDPTIVPIDGAPDLTVSKDDGGGDSSPSDTVVYTLSYDNIGTQDATGVVLTETVPANTTFDPAASTTGWTCVPDGDPGSVCTFAVGDVAVNDPAGSVDFAVSIDSPVPLGVTQIANSVSISDDGNNGADPDPDNNDDDDTTPLVLMPELEVTKRDSLESSGSSFNPGDVLRYTVTITSVGDVAATGVVYADTPDPNTILEAGSVITSQGTVTLGNGGGETDIEVDIGTIEVGNSVTLTYTVVIDPALMPDPSITLFNQGLVTSGNAPDEPTDDPDSPDDDDPTTTEVTNVNPIPTVGEWGLLLLILLIAASGYLRLRW
jgi:uncharacterized repeat protein (TIGR01451 family)/fimbrial isopeptide formation D2 family protein